jgi:hypothetical protein
VRAAVLVVVVEPKRFRDSPAAVRVTVVGRAGRVRSAGGRVKVIRGGEWRAWSSRRGLQPHAAGSLIAVAVTLCFRLCGRVWWRGVTRNAPAYSCCVHASRQASPRR